MTVRSFTNQETLKDADPNKLADVLRHGKIDLAQLLDDLSGPVEETVTVGATFASTLTKSPIGAVTAARKTGGYLAQTQVDKNCTLGAHQFHVNYQTRAITFENTDFNDGDEAVVTYLGLTAGTASSELASKLAEAFES
jgi:hypothetical protein